jgi:hypothetical protein
MHGPLTKYIRRHALAPSVYPFASHKSLMSSRLLFLNKSSPFAILLIIIKYLSSAGLLESTCRKLTTLRGRPLHLHWKPFSHILSMAISATHQSSSSLLVRVYGIFEKTFLSRFSIHLYTALRTSNRFHDRDLGFLTTHILDVPISSRPPVN